MGLIPVDSSNGILIEQHKYNIHYHLKLFLYLKDVLAHLLLQLYNLIWYVSLFLIG